MAEEEKPKEDRSPQLWIGLVIVLAITILIAFFWEPSSEESVVKSTTDKSFPLTLWLIVLTALLAFRVYAEISGLAEKFKETAWMVTVKMISVYSIYATIGIFILQGSVPNWWKNLLSSSIGKYLLYCLALWVVLKYISPKTGSGSVKWGGKFSTPVGIILIIGTIIAAIGIGFGKSSNYAPRYTKAEAAVARQQVYIPKPAPKPTLSGKYEICWERYGEERCIRPRINVTGDSLSSDYTNGAEHLKFSGHRESGSKYSGKTVFSRPGKVSSRDFSLDFENMSGSLEVRGGQFEEVTIKKLS